MSDEQVLVIPRKILFGENDENSFQGFFRGYKDLKTIFNSDSLSYRPRSVVETEVEYKQIIPYLFFTQGDKVLAYQRTKKGGEDRLHSKWSVGFGGHMNDGDQDLEEAIKRERAEELNFNWENSFGNFVGAINDDSNVVGQVHLGLVYWTEVFEGTPTTDDPSISNIGWKSKEELLGSELENWSRVLLENFNF